MENQKKIYFASDQHFGAPTSTESFPREQLFLNWLNKRQHTQVQELLIYRRM